MAPRRPAGRLTPDPCHQGQWLLSQMPSSTPEGEGCRALGASVPLACGASPAPEGPPSPGESSPALLGLPLPAPTLGGLWGLHATKAADSSHRAGPVLRASAIPPPVTSCMCPEVLVTGRGWWGLSCPQLSGPVQLGQMRRVAPS